MNEQSKIERAKEIVASISISEQFQHLTADQRLDKAIDLIEERHRNNPSRRTEQDLEALKYYRREKKKLEALIWKKCQENNFLKEFGYYTREDPFMEIDYTLSCLWCTTIEELKRAFMQYDAFRTCFIFKDLIFVNQTAGGGWEAWTLKRFGDELIDFESISMQLIIKEGTHDGLTFEQYIEKLQSLSREQVIHYLEG